ncbi:hypothetical protein GOC60_10180 [Sinorhizobium meliloti]|nr:hypothetical protein [Sinorhizobium meliloti]MDX0348912.1 hypothetical protein [Sinorhizobium meliloti]
MSPEILQARQRIEAKIQELIEILDLIDGDADLEPALGWPLLGPRVLIQAAYADNDREYEDEREGDPAEHGICDLGALNVTLQEEDWFGTLDFNGTGNSIAIEMLRRFKGQTKQ